MKVGDVMMSKNYSLSIVIPARNEIFLSRTVHDILENMEANTEIICVLDGSWARPAIPQHERVNVIYVPESIGQRAATNLGVRLSKADFILKCDAHCSFDRGFDRKMIEFFKEHGDNITATPIMRNLWAFNWKCYQPMCGWEKYQGPRPKVCEKCGKSGKVRMKMMWIGKGNPQSWSYSFDPSPHFQYFGEYKHRPGVRKNAKRLGFSETMSLQGSCFMATREKYWELDLGGEEFGSWGNQGIQVALATWLSGGRVLVNHRTWYRHLFRTQGPGFGFPYPQSGRAVRDTKKSIWETFVGGNWPKQIHPVSWLVRRFEPVPGWTEDDIRKLKEMEK